MWFRICDIFLLHVFTVKFILQLRLEGDARIAEAVFVGMLWPDVCFYLENTWLIRLQLSIRFPLSSGLCSQPLKCIGLSFGFRVLENLTEAENGLFHYLHIQPEEVAFSRQLYL